MTRRTRERGSFSRWMPLKTARYYYPIRFRRPGYEGTLSRRTSFRVLLLSRRRPGWVSRSKLPCDSRGLEQHPSGGPPSPVPRFSTPAGDLL